MNNKINVNDSLFLSDENGGYASHLQLHTDIIFGHNLHEDKLSGHSIFDEVIFRTHNTVTVSGVQYQLSQMLGVEGPIKVPTLYETLNIGIPNQTFMDQNVQVPGGEHKMPFHYGNTICLFGIGLTGSGQNAITKYPVDYRENALQMTKQAEDGTTLEGIMLPFRYTSQDLSENEQKVYFGKKQHDAYTGYYLKRFEANPVIKHVWVTGDDYDSYVDITNDEIWSSVRNTPIRSMAEIQLKISNKDIKDFFDITGRLDEPAFNTLGLYYADYDSAQGDYCNVRLATKLYIPTENVSLSKDVDILYRIYAAGYKKNEAKK